MFSVWYFFTYHSSYYNNNSSEDINYPTIHSSCSNNNSCGGDLICDIKCNRCKKKIGGNCSGDVDCETGLICHNWICTDKKPFHDNISSEAFDQLHSSNIKKKNVHWNDSNDIFLI